MRAQTADLIEVINGSNGKDQKKPGEVGEVVLPVSEELSLPVKTQIPIPTKSNVSSTRGIRETEEEDKQGSTRMEQRFSDRQPQINFASGSCYSGDNTHRSTIFQQL